LLLSENVDGFFRDGNVGFVVLGFIVEEP
jgi:hypothetical protein